MWFRRDLRLHDHPALLAALDQGDVVPLFVDDPVFDTASPVRKALLHDLLLSLREATAGALVVRRGRPVDVVSTLAAEIDAPTVFVTGDHTPYGRARDEAVAGALHGAGRHLQRVGSNYVVEPGTVRKSGGEPYVVFTPFLRSWRKHEHSVPAAAPSSPSWAEAPSDPLPARPILDGSFEDVMFDRGEAEAHARWDRFRADGLGRYADRRNSPADAGTSGLSAALRFGVIHPRQLLAVIDYENQHHLAFQSELAWRDFYAGVLFHRPETAWWNVDRKLAGIQVDTGAAARERFRRWCAGTTGFPIVDAGMRQLQRTGWMHNRVRMIVASFLVKDLHLPWQWGARYFMERLVDGDLASNNHGWQWAAGTGTDAAPYFRVFNPAAQQERWDAKGEYVRRWIPELGKPDYPAPMVDHAAERAEALRRYKAARER